MSQTVDIRELNERIESKSSFIIKKQMYIIL